MREIWIPEVFITLFLLLPLIRPFVKKLMPIDGISRLPLLSFLILVVLIPAYGLRPELLPLFVYAAFMAVITLARQIKGAAKAGGFEGTQFAFSIPPLVLLTAAAGIAFFFSPQIDTDLSAEDVLTLSVDAETAGNGKKEYSIRIYTGEIGGASSPRPLLVVLPPAFGSHTAVDRVCGELRGRGFTVLSYSGRQRYWRSFRAFSSGTESVRANASGRALEEDMKNDILFLLSWMRQNPAVGENLTLFELASPGAIFLAGYGTGGSALLLLEDSFSPDGIYRRASSEPGFPAGALKIRGLVAVESPLWSAYSTEASDTEGLPSDAGWFRSAGYRIKNWFKNRFRDMKMEEVPAPDIPVLFLVSDRSREAKYRDGRYRAPLECFRAARGFAALTSVDGAGPLDYSDFPARYPIVSAFFSGREKPAWNNFSAPGGTAAIITGFAAGILEAEDGTSFSLLKEPVPAGVRTERRNFRRGE